MADLKTFNENPQRQLLEEIKGSRCVMLGNPAPGAHMQPMAPQVDADAGVIYFYSDNTSDLGKAVLKGGAIVHMCHMESDYQACVKGSLTATNDRAIIDRFWNPIVDAWYPGGKDDPKMLLLRFDPIDAAIWASDKNPLTFAYEIAKANITDEEPDLGKMKNVAM
jgi:general stress protein 26